VTDNGFIDEPRLKPGALGLKMSLNCSSRVRFIQPLTRSRPRLGEKCCNLIRFTFAGPKKFRVMLATGTGPRFREEKSIDQILIPLPEGTWPDHIFSKSGTNILSFTKYDPVALKRVAFEPVLHLASVAPYAALINIEQPNR
jgi:hypothetical protein